MNDKRDDGTLVERARGGDREAFTALVGRYRGMVYAAAFCFLGNAEDAQDAAQEAFVAAYSRLGQLREPDKFAPWLRRLALNGCADTLRRRGSRLLSLDGDAACRALATPDGAETIVTRLAVRDALARLPERARLTVTLCALEGHSHAEVARFLDVPVNTVRSRLQYAKRRLREEMRDMMLEEMSGGRPDEAWTRRVVDEALRRGQEAASDYDKGMAIGHYDAALAAIGTLPPGAEQKKLTMEALWRKGRAADPLRFGSEEGLALLEQSLALAGEIGDKRALMTRLMEMGRAYYNSGLDSKGAECLERARALASEIGDARAQASALTGLGTGRLWGDGAQGLALFQSARALYESAGDLKGATYCRAMLAVADRLGPDKVRVDYSPAGGFKQPVVGFYAGSDTFRSENGAVSHVDESCYIGYTWPEELRRSPLKISRVFWLASHLQKILDAAVPVGGHWSGNAFSNTAQPLKATVTVLSDTETVTVPAGTFDGCLLTEQVTTEDGPATAENAGLCGTVRAWYTAGVGLVQIHARHADGLEATMRLESYVVGGGSGGRLPLAAGNRWEYGWADLPAGYSAREVYHVAAQGSAEAGGMWHVEHWAYAEPTPGAVAPTPPSEGGVCERGFG